MSSSERPTILFVTGLWQQVSHYSAFLDALQTRGFETVQPALPSLDGEREKGMHADAACVSKEVRRLVEEEEKKVLIVAHSQGGMPATEGLKLDTPKRLEG